MASEEVLKQLFETAKTSGSFKGMSESEIWDACLAYKNRSDSDIRIAMENIRKKDAELYEKAKKQRGMVEESKKKLIDLKEKEDEERQKDSITAEKVIEDFFNL